MSQVFVRELILLKLRLRFACIFQRFAIFFMRYPLTFRGATADKSETAGLQQDFVEAVRKQCVNQGVKRATDIRS